MTRTPDDRPPYSRQHTAADPSNVVTENEVPNEAKALPSQKGPALLLAFGGAGVALAATICEFMRLDLLALILAILAVVMTIVSVIMARNDQRTGMGAPVLCLVVSAAVLVIVLFDVTGADDVIRDTQQEVRDDTRDRLDDDATIPPAGSGN